MTGMQWVRLDTAFYGNPKVIELTATNRHRALAVYICGLAYAGNHGTEGWIPYVSLSVIHGRKQDAGHLVEVGLWTADDGGWFIHDWHDYQPTNEIIAMRTQEATRRARSAANIRWHGTADP